MSRTETASITSVLSRRQLLAAFALLLLLWGLAGPAAAAQTGRVAVYLGREIAPYVAMVEGFEAALSPQPVERVFLDPQGRPYSLTGSPNPVPQGYQAVVAVGPRALDYLQPRAGDIPVLFGMVLNPEADAESSGKPLCGVSLNLPIAAQLQALAEHLPQVRRLGILYDPANNQDWFDHAQALAPADLSLVPLRVSSAAGRRQIVSTFAGLDAVMFIPDRTIISQAFIRYVIEQAFVRRLPVIGYNQYFVESGATLGFVIDYQQLGRQVAELVQTVLNGDSCPGVEPPPFRVEMNRDMATALGLELTPGRR